MFSASDAEFVTSRRTRDLIPQAREAVEKALEENFGTGQNLVAWLRFPVNYGGDGRILKSGWSLYMKHCVQCHGGSGGGNGPTAKNLNPQPRDFRLGIFKFTSTAHQEKATREDLKRTVKDGIPGTAMPSFELIEDERIETIVEYVRWLAIRGEFEKKLACELAIDYSVSAVKERKQMGETDREIEDELAWFLEDELAGMIDSAADDLAEAWTRADEKAGLVLPAVIREDTINGIAADVADWMQENGKSLRHGQLEALAKRQMPNDADNSSPKEYVTVRVQLDSDVDGSIEGRQLLWTSGTLKGHKYEILTSNPPVPGEFVLEPQQDAPPLAIQEAPLKGSRFVVCEEIPGRLAYVVRHGAGLNELSKMAAEDPGKLQRQLILDSPGRGRSLYLTPKSRCAECHGQDGRGDGELTREFAKIPGTNDNYPTPGLYDSWDNKVKPQDLARGIYRGGEEPIDLYRRIFVGIKGTPMPAFGETALSEDEIWDLVNYVLSVPSDDPSFGIDGS